MTRIIGRITWWISPPWLWRVIDIDLLPGPEDADRPVLITVEVRHA